MIRGLVNRALGGGRRGAAGGTARPAGRPTTGGSTANRDIERGARSLLRGFGRKRKGL